MRFMLLQNYGPVESDCEFRAAAARTANLRERQYLTTRAARLASDPGPVPAQSRGTRPARDRAQSTSFIPSWEATKPRRW